MKNKIVLLAGIIFNSFLSAQSEFTTFNNGLIYNEHTMDKLERIVDSLNLKYKTCDLNKVFYSQQQVKGHIIRLSKGNVAQAKKDMDMNISFENFVSKYPDAEIQKDVLIIKLKTKDYHEKDIIRFYEIRLDDDYELKIDKEYKKTVHNKPVKNTWYYEYSDKTSYSNESVKAFYFPENMKSIPLDPKYSRQIIYSDCLIDTSITKFKENSSRDRYDLNRRIKLPYNWKNLTTPEKEKILDEMRSNMAVGMCSQDNSPRIQGINMALLSADIAHWGLFLKSHLDIMNDRFERVSDASYAWGNRQTYIKELEELDINVPDLIFGISFRIENPVNNHYYGSIGRLGRAISESKDREKFLSQMLSMIRDEDLDDYNRVLSYFLYINCNHYIENEREKKINKLNLNDAVKKLPQYLSEKIKPEKI
ncbi:hypothetical protein HNP38_000993 [Chryseobacterium defluvii]|uniref:Uncharacterized protein n=1 Tax=Chryseobacterium defluvii TaxID=160396 RepID=A0A840K899_9FLAO|nr:hypothetical protein [Chryseobacterium defluvii]MBB4805721.1 hypothetical protein [Chryseobacterium defluvii]